MNAEREPADRVLETARSFRARLGDVVVDIDTGRTDDVAGELRRVAADLEALAAAVEHAHTMRSTRIGDVTDYGVDPWAT